MLPESSEDLAVPELSFVGKLANMPSRHKSLQNALKFNVHWLN